MSGNQSLKGFVATEDLPPRILGYLNAAACSHDWRDAESLLLRAQATDPDCLQVYYTLYKFYFNHKRLSDAERQTCLALDAAARQAKIEADWRLQKKDSCDWSIVSSPQHFYLFSLKALAFIRLRQLRIADANVILAKLREIDPDDSVGASVIESYATGASV
ncbi:MAG: hypothetical protein PSV17_13470 [Methylotenera sp.]|uniref:hypothetical protein n=1 Tax=Methylotenera sp. TaxID=2051956 RepID=UPI002488B2EF|nr:hypothetical protein [Methylotenera sp.]MDI1310423.1 hypothetical protein [Methylotenera sp.]